ncbi:MAG: site-specific integrase [Saprospiraceae bacterium]|nr:site-specific integrase [Saprospiraceae bacterium]
MYDKTNLQQDKNINIQSKLGKLFDEFINECQFATCLRPETIRGYIAVFNLFSKLMPEIISTDELTTEMLNTFFKRIKTRSRIVGRNTVKIGVKSSTIKTQYSKLTVFFDWLCKKAYLVKNPLKDIKAPQVNYDDFRRLEDEDINKIYSAIVRCSTNSMLLRRDTVMVSLLLFCGLRKGEFISIQVKDIDIDKKEIIVRGETSKSKRKRVLKIHPTLLMHLKDYFKERRNFKTEYLIVSNRGDSGLTREGLKHWVKSISDKSGVKFHLHEFRHTFACKLAEADVNIFKIQKMMGHQNITMTMKYSRSLQTDDMEQDISKIYI